MPWQIFVAQQYAIRCKVIISLTAYEFIRVQNSRPPSAVAFRRKRLQVYDVLGENTATLSLKS